MVKSVVDRARCARMVRRDEGAYCSYVTAEQRSQQRGCIDREGDRLSYSWALSSQPEFHHDVAARVLWVLLRRDGCEAKLGVQRNSGLQCGV
jgi:hypothetical protein